MVLYRKWLRNPTSFVLQNILPRLIYRSRYTGPRRPKFQLWCRLVIVNENEFGEKLREIVVKMRNDGLCLFVDIIENPVKVSIRDSPPSRFFKTVEEIDRAMMTFNNPHVLYKGMVYCKPKDASFTFVEIMDPESYSNKLLASEVLPEQVMRHMNALMHVMSNPQCEVFPQIKIDFNFIKVNSSYCSNKTNDLILNLTPENVTQHSRIVTTTRKGSSTPTKMSKIIGRQIH